MYKQILKKKIYLSRS